MSESQIALVVRASVDQLAHLQECLPDWECVSVPLNDEETAIRSIRTAPTLAIVYARKEEKNTLAVCEQLRNSPQSSTTPTCSSLAGMRSLRGMPLLVWEMRRSS
jgi:CheY-like chemotaxis protein